MQFPSQKSQIRIPAVAYEQSRLEIKNGDVLMYRGRSWASRVIRWATGSPYSHAGLAAWWNKRLMVMEAVGKGVVVTPISNNVQAYSGRVEWFTTVEDIPSDQRLRMIECAQQDLGKEYALWPAIWLGIRALFQRDLQTRDKLRQEKRLFCSLYVAKAYNAIGRDLKKGVGDRFMSPGDIASSPILKKVGVLYKTKRPARKQERGDQSRVEAASGTASQ